MSHTVKEDVFIDMQLSDDEMKSVLEGTSGNKHDESGQIHRSKINQQK